MRLKAGDIFSIDIDEEKVGFGQILFKPKYQLFIIVFEEVHYKKNVPTLDKIVNPVPLLMGCTLDGMLYQNYWKVIGNYKNNVNSYPLPFYKEGIPPDDIFIVNYKGERLRKADAEEYNVLNYRSVVAPIYFEEALKAHYNFIPWSDSYDEIVYKNILQKTFSINI